MMIIEVYSPTCLIIARVGRRRSNNNASIHWTKSAADKIGGRYLLVCASLPLSTDFLIFLTALPLILCLALKCHSSQDKTSF